MEVPPLHDFCWGMNYSSAVHFGPGQLVVVFGTSCQASWSRGEDDRSEGWPVATSQMQTTVFSEPVASR